MERFPGFRSAGVHLVPLPEGFFTELLPLVDDLVELKITLFLAWLLSRKEGTLRVVTRRELEENSIVLHSLESRNEAGQQALWAGLERAVDRGSVLRFIGRSEGREMDCYVLNTEKGRRLSAGLKDGTLDLPVPELPGARWTPERPNIFALYEQNIGLLTPLMADELREAEENFPESWIEDAFRLAVRRNARNWSYVRAILERWAQEGKNEVNDQL